MLQDGSMARICKLQQTGAGHHTYYCHIILHRQNLILGASNDQQWVCEVV